MGPVQLVIPDVNDAQVLSELGAQTFIHSYQTSLDPEVLKTYVDRAFSVDQIILELNDPEIYYLMAQDDRRACAYAKLWRSPLPADLLLENAVELQRLYVIQDYWGQGIGTRLMQKLLERASQRDCRHIWLRVWQQNNKAITFYRRWNFKIIGQEPYSGCDDEMVWIMSRSLIGL